MFSENRHYISRYVNTFVTKRFGRVKDSLKGLLPILVTLFSLNFTHAQNLIRQGSSRYSTPIYNWDGLSLRNGNSSYGKVIINWDGKFIRNGSNPYGTVLYNWDGENIRIGHSQYNSALYNWDGKYLRKGPGFYGPVLYNTDGSIPVFILLYILLLKNEY